MFVPTEEKLRLDKLKIKRHLRKFQKKLDKTQTKLVAAHDECRRLQSYNQERDKFHYQLLVDLKNEIRSLESNGAGYRQVFDPYE